MQHQYWVTKKCVLRKLGSKEDECIISSDAELDAKLELFRSIADSCVQLQKVIDLYQERLCYLAQEENALGRYLKECGKNEKNSNAGQIMATAGKALAYTGHQRLTIRSPLVRLHHEVETFRGRAVSDTRTTVLEMEKVRTEYRAALSWMKSTSTQLDPDTGHGLERFRKAQSYVKSSKIRFDRLMLACLQKVDLLAAARCNMFSHALVSYQSAISNFSNKASDTLTVAATKLNNTQPYDFCAVTELTTPTENAVDKDQNTFFNAEYTDQETLQEQVFNKNEAETTSSSVANLLGEDFNLLENENKSNQSLLDLSWPSKNSDFLGGDFMPSRFIQDGNMSFDDASNLNQIESNMKEETKDNIKDKNSKTGSQVSWLSLFAELDPLANQDSSIGSVSDRA